MGFLRAVGRFLSNINPANVFTAGKRIKRANERYKSERDDYEQAVEMYQEDIRETQESLTQLGQRKLQAMPTLGRAAEYLKKASVRRRNTHENVTIEPEVLERWEGEATHAREILGGGARALSAGTATAVGAYSLVGMFGSASTGTAISMLSGAASKSAVLAWFGGGSLAAGGGGVALGTTVLGGIVAVPALMVVGWVANSKAEKAETATARLIAEMHRSEAQMERDRAALFGIRMRAQEIEVAVNMLDRDLADELDRITSLPASWLPRLFMRMKRFFTRRRDQYRVYLLAISLGQAIDTNVLEETVEIAA